MRARFAKPAPSRPGEFRVDAARENPRALVIATSMSDFALGRSVIPWRMAKHAGWVTLAIVAIVACSKGKHPFAKDNDGTASGSAAPQGSAAAGSAAPTPSGSA